VAASPPTAADVVVRAPVLGPADPALLDGSGPVSFEALLCEDCPLPPELLET
jgi:hypothetical protein